MNKTTREQVVKVLDYEIVDCLGRIKMPSSPEGKLEEVQLLASLVTALTLVDTTGKLDSINMAINLH